MVPKQSAHLDSSELHGSPCAFGLGHNSSSDEYSRNFRRFLQMNAVTANHGKCFNRFTSKRSVRMSDDWQTKEQYY